MPERQPVPCPTPRPGPMRLSPRRAWQPLFDGEWTALIPYVGDRFYREARAPGRPLSCDPRARLDAMLQAAVTGTPWHLLPETRGGRGTTVGRHFTRLAHAGLWTRLLEAVADPRRPPVLASLE